MRRLFVGVIVLSLAACGSPGSQERSSSPSTGPNTTTTTSTAPGSTTTTPAPSAFDQLAGFVKAARTLDGQLRAAAVVINAAGPPWPEITPAVAAAVGATKLGPVSAAVPAGLPEPLLQHTVLVYSDLVSRDMAMRYFGLVGPVRDQDWLLNGLRNGAPAAARFPNDLAVLIALARSTGPVTIAAPTSRQAAVRDLLVQFVDLANGGCASTGGQVFPTLPNITWSSPTSGQIGGVNFTARLVGSSWKILLMAC